MKKFHLTTREVLYFFLGVLTMIIIDLIFAWRDCNKDFNDGMDRTSVEIRK